MFDITSSKLLILAIIALIVVGPKDLPVLLRTVGKYLGVIRRHASEFRAQFDEAIRETELEQLRKEFDAVRDEMRSTVEQGSRALEAGIAKAGTDAEPARKEGDSAAASATPAPQPSDAIAAGTEPGASEPAASTETTPSFAQAPPQTDMPPPDPQAETQPDKTGT